MSEQERNDVVEETVENLEKEIKEIQTEADENEAEFTEKAEGLLDDVSERFENSREKLRERFSQKSEDFHEFIDQFKDEEKVKKMREDFETKVKKLSDEAEVKVNSLKDNSKLNEAVDKTKDYALQLGTFVNRYIDALGDSDLAKNLGSKAKEAKEKVGNITKDEKVSETAKKLGENIANTFDKFVKKKDTEEVKEEENSGSEE